MIWHLVRGDLRRHRVLLGLWLLLSTATAAIEGVAPFFVLEGEPAILFDLATLGLNLATFVAGVVLAPLVLQTDPLIGTTAFWMTRPIAPGTLAAAKLLLLFAAGVALPVAINAGVMAASGVPGRVITLAAVGSVLSRSVWTALTVAFGAITQTLPRYLMALGACAAGLITVLVAGVSVAAIWGSDEISVYRWTPPRPTADVAGNVLIAIALAAVAIAQAHTRLRRVSVAVGAIALAVAVVARDNWPWPAFDPRLAPPAWSADATAGRLWLDPASVEPERTAATTSRTELRTVRGRAQLHGMPEGWAALVRLLDGELRLPGGTTIRSRSGAAGHPPLPGDTTSALTEAARAALRVDRIEAAYPPKAESLPLLVIPDDEFRRSAPAEADYAARFEVMPTRYLVEARAPLVTGSIVAGSDYRLEAIAVDRRPESVTVTAVESWLRTEFDSTVMTERKFYLVHGGCRCAVELHDGFGSTHMQFPWLPISLAVPSSASTRQRRLSYPHPYGSPVDPYPVDDEWLSQAQIVVVRADTYPPFERELSVKAFPLRLPQPGPKRGQE